MPCGGNHWLVLATVVPVGLALVFVREWREAGRLRQELMPALLDLEAQGREFVVKLENGDGNAPAPALTWSRATAQWFRDVGFAETANVLQATIEPEHSDYATKAIWNRKAEVERRAQAVVERVLVEVRKLKARLEERIARR